MTNSNGKAVISRHGVKYDSRPKAVQEAEPIVPGSLNDKTFVYITPESAEDFRKLGIKILGDQEFKNSVLVISDFIRASPLPRSFSAPPQSKTTLLSVTDETLQLILAGKFALIRPVTTSTDGRCVAMMRCMPHALDFCASIHICLWKVFLETCIRSENSSITRTI